MLDSEDGDTSLPGDTFMQCPPGHDETGQIYQDGTAQKLDCGICQGAHLNCSGWAQGPWGCRASARLQF